MSKHPYCCPSSPGCRRGMGKLRVITPEFTRLRKRNVQRNLINYQEIKCFFNIVVFCSEFLSYFLNERNYSEKKVFSLFCRHYSFS